MGVLNKRFCHWSRFVTFLQYLLNNLLQEQNRALLIFRYSVRFYKFEFGIVGWGVVHNKYDNRDSVG